MRASDCDSKAGLTAQNKTRIREASERLVMTGSRGVLMDKSDALMRKVHQWEEEYHRLPFTPRIVPEAVAVVAPLI